MIGLDQLALAHRYDEQKKPVWAQRPWYADADPEYEHEMVGGRGEDFYGTDGRFPI
jgi:hypothetical protein